MKKKREITPSNGNKADVFAAAVKAARVKLGLTQEAFAQLLETPLGTVRGWEQGRRKPPPCAMLLMCVAVDHPEVIIGISAKDSGQAIPEQKPESSERGEKTPQKNSITAELHEPGVDADFWLL